MRFLCRIGWHIWTLWEDSGGLYRDGAERPVAWLQKRFCEHCGRKQSRRY